MRRTTSEQCQIRFVLTSELWRAWCVVIQILYINRRTLAAGSRRNLAVLNLPSMRRIGGFGGER